MSITATKIARLQAEVEGLLEESAGGRGLTPDEQSTIRERGPVAFGEERLGSRYWSRQVDLLNATWKHPRVAARSANSMGKNYSAADFKVWWMAQGGGVLYMAPTDRQLDIGMRELTRALRGSGLPFERFHRRIRLDGEDRLLALTSHSADSLRGFHDPRGLLVVIDEGQGQSVEAVAYDAAFSCATGEADKILVLGNPAHPGGRFHTISKARHWHAIRIPAHEHPNIVEGRTVIHGGPAPDWPDQIAAEYGRDSAFYQAFVEAEFPEEGSIDSLLRGEWVDAAFDRHDAGTGITLYPRPVAALDVARSVGRDESVCALAQGTRLESLAAWRSRDLVDTADRFLTLVERKRLELWAASANKVVGSSFDDADQLGEWLSARRVAPFRLVVDAPGVGSGVVDECRRRRRDVVEWWGWSPCYRTEDERRFANQRAAGYWGLRKLLENGECELPRDPMLREEALAVEYTLDGKGRIVILAKEDLRKTLGRSPDRLDAVVIALATAAGVVRQPTIQFTSLKA